MAKSYKLRWRDSQGKHRQKTFPTRAERDDFKISLRRLEEEPDSRTFEEFSAVYLAEHCRVEKAPSQWRADERDLEAHLIPALGRIPLSELRPEHLLALRTRLATEDVGRYRRRLSPKTVNNVLTLARRIGAVAVERGLLRLNPFAKVKPLKLPTQTFDYWLPEELERFCRFCKQLDPAFAELVEVAGKTGLRFGELRGLRCGDLDHEAGRIRVERSWCSKTRTFVPPKNKTAATVPMADDVRKLLRTRKLMQGIDPIFDPDLFRNGGHRFEAFCLKTGSRVIRFHDLRHTFASTLVARGVPIYEVQKLLRHKSIQMTERYAHLAPEHLWKAVQAVCASRVRAEESGAAEVGMGPG